AAGRYLVRVGRAQDQRAALPHLFVQQADRVLLRIVRAEGIGADELGQARAEMRLGLPHRPHLVQDDRDTRARHLQRRLAVGPTWRHAIEKRDGSSARPNVPLTPPVRAWLMWQATPGTFGSSNALTHTRSFLPRNRNVVLTQGKSSARAALAAITSAVAKPT